jgi:hypothetical protein
MKLWASELLSQLKKHIKVDDLVYYTHVYYKHEIDHKVCLHYVFFCVLLKYLNIGILYRHDIHKVLYYVFFYVTITKLFDLGYCLLQILFSLSHSHSFSTVYSCTYECENVLSKPHIQNVLDMSVS